MRWVFGRTKRPPGAAAVLAVLVAAGAGESGLDSLGRAVNAELRGDWARALALYGRAIEAEDLSPRHLAVALANRCGLRGERGDAAGAIADCDRAIAIDPALALAYTNRGAAYGALGEHRRAIDDHTAAIALAPGLAVAYNNRCESRLRSGALAPALADCDRAVALDPGLALAHYTRGEVLAAKGDHGLAGEAFGRAYALAPRHPVVHAKAHALGLGP
jgi:tetratricopeptide (TPR) repeat protein